MSTSGDAGSQRVGDAERQAAIDALGVHWRAGRLDPAEHERRTTAAFAAVTRGDLDALFADLPGGQSVVPVDRPGTVAQPGPVAGPVAAPVERGSGGLFPPDSWVGQHRDTVMALTPFAALLLFFGLRSWLFFLLVPVMGIVLYAGGDEDPNGRKARRAQREQRRRLERGD